MSQLGGGECGGSLLGSGWDESPGSLLGLSITTPVGVLGFLMRVEVSAPHSAFAGIGVATVFLWSLAGVESSYCLKLICLAKLLY